MSDKATPFQPIEPVSASEAVKRQIEGLILDGVLRPGERLPAERELAKLLGVSRPTLRAALKDLERDKLIQTRHGGGTSVSNVLGSAFVDPLVELMRTHPGAASDYLEFRKEVEGAAAYFAALRATDADRKIIATVFAAMVTAHEETDYLIEADLDAEFHLTIAEASHNLVLLHIMRGMFELLKQEVFFNRAAVYGRQGPRDALLEQHRAVHDAILAGNADDAREAVREHLTYLQECIRNLGRYEARAAVAARRLTQIREALETQAEGAGPGTEPWPSR